MLYFESFMTYFKEYLPEYLVKIGNLDCLNILMLDMNLLYFQMFNKLNNNQDLNFYNY